MSTRPRRSTLSSVREDDSHRRPYTRAMSSSTTYTRSAYNPPLDFSTQEKDTSGCYACRFRKKKCCMATPSADRCVDCVRFNIVCNGQGSQRPSGRDIALQVRQMTKKWIGDKNKRHFDPLDLSSAWIPSAPTISREPEGESPLSDTFSDEGSPIPEYDHELHPNSPVHVNEIPWSEAHPRPDLLYPDRSYTSDPGHLYDPFSARCPDQEYSKPPHDRAECWYPANQGSGPFGQPDTHYVSPFVSPSSSYDGDHQDAYIHSASRSGFRWAS